MFTFLTFVVFGLLFFLDLGSFASAENIVSVVVGLLATLGVTEFIKRWQGLYGFGATLLAVGVSFIIGLAAVLIQMAVTGDFSPEKLGAYALTIFTTATLAYRAVKPGPAN
jgi:hypothetical protein